MNNKSTLEVKNLSFGYCPGEHILSNISLSLCAGDMMTLMGPNGSGKTTLLSCIMQDLTPYSGDILVCNKNVADYSLRELARLIAYVPQKSESPFDYLVKDYAVMGRNAHISFLSQPSKEDYERVDHYLEVLGVYKYRNRLMQELSGGEQQLVSIARAMVQEPQIIILDEPTAALDYGNSIKILNILSELRTAGYTIIMTSHDPNHAFMLGGYVSVLSRDRHFSFGSVEDVLTEENLCQLYDSKVKIISLKEYGRSFCINIY